MADWRLIDGRYPADHDDALPAKAIESEFELVQELDRLRELEPGIFTLNSPTGEALQIGIGGPLAGLRWFENPQTSVNSRDVLADRPSCPGRVDFHAEDEEVPFWPEHLLPVEQAIDIVVFFFTNQRLPDWVAWEEWDSTHHHWNVHRPAVLRSG
jgi:hypothetical protein